MSKRDEEEWNYCQRIAEGWIAGHFMRVTKRERELSLSLAKLLQRDRALASIAQRENSPTDLERQLARTVIETCIAAGHPDDESAPSVPFGKCSCEMVPSELVPEEYR